MENKINISAPLAQRSIILSDIKTSLFFFLFSALTALFLLTLKLSLSLATVTLSGLAVFCLVIAIQSRLFSRNVKEIMTLLWIGDTECAALCASVLAWSSNDHRKRLHYLRTRKRALALASCEPDETREEYIEMIEDFFKETEKNLPTTSLYTLLKILKKRMDVE